VAVPRLTATAHQCEPVIPAAAENPVGCALERRLRCHRTIKGVPLGVVVLLTVRTPTQRLAEEEIANTELADRVLELLAVEVGCVARVRVGTHIHEKADSLAE